MVLLPRSCQECHRPFKGGPRAYYCPACRIDRQKVRSREGKRKERAGTTRKLGSVDACQRCAGEYVVKSGQQRFCEECSAVHAAEHDRVTALEYYHAKKDVLNPVRNKRRRKAPAD